ncbi:precorrin-3B C(17)-methyltransferase [Phaeobacter inhibens]|uniref:precorrin-3B C(17)-methyltransferase n=1 Tax=Phaeobacter inhibens TaxID=221822 RepID=UPI0004208261|nr:precorrin-3B C(17)-methyltransferase [Phaeobacter inhibens]AUQ61773.1 precorrin-3B C(17)-methyltransferase CobJ [Phaeobacter inhibens]AUQ81747.1 precorrin-3B C(17)-methyltransferase CobJ [Phaeobacter inhibens]AUQ89470.1 precorrin-3B C(17)-methyltransferase CobJ [Phaeobacter inhibens]MDO6757135.1 precorrin-3B C(17)-methyltransferase [Phaeobacter inhibens]
MKLSQNGWVVIAGLGPGNEALVTQEVRDVIDEATDIVGYIPYVKRIAPREGLTLHATDNRVEVDRATHALEMAAEGKRVVVVSSGDPGVFAMASAVFEALENNAESRPEWLDLEIKVLPGITAMLAAAAAIGAPLGHDFAAINLSDNLKPWSLIEKRLQLVGEAGLAMAFYNPRSKSRPHQFARALEILREACGAETLITFARDVTKPGQELLTVPLKDAKPEMADMRTVVIVGNRDTRRIGSYVYTPRYAAEG